MWSSGAATSKRDARTLSLIEERVRMDRLRLQRIVDNLPPST